jgi:hypothetical protein
MVRRYAKRIGIAVCGFDSRMENNNKATHLSAKNSNNIGTTVVCND